MAGRINCPICTRRRFNTEYLSELLRLDGYTLLSKYRNANSRIAVLCPRGHKSQIFYSNYSRGHRCRLCSDTKHSDVDIDAFLEPDGYQRSGRYQGALKPLAMRCPLGHDIKISISDYQKGSRCGVCYQESRNNYETARSFARSQGFEFVSEVPVRSKQKISIRCPQGHTYTSTWYHFMRGSRCTVCNSSHWEQEFHSFLKELGVEYRYNVRDVIDGEIDFLVGDVGFELHGLYFHDDRHVGRDYHRQKYLRCKEEGIKLIQLFDFEWYKRRTMVEGMIRSELGLVNVLSHSICVADRDIPNEEIITFMDENHIKGYHHHTESYGFRYNKELIGCLTIHSDSTNRILNRVCFKSGFTMMGGVEALVDLIPDKAGLHIFIDHRFTDGSEYIRIGFVELSTIEPEYFHIKHGVPVATLVDDQTRYSRVHDAGGSRLVYPA